ncbi:Cleavage and polyadenylation specificity factor subunit 1 [Phlyctochytrium planicorne]|nr:Cleavage and polyadenylation specificity factor subunit 1 [Phlyctochytrium planicorne]
MYALWKEAHPPTAVDASVEARFISPDAVNLVVAKSHILQVYNVIEVDEDTGKACSNITNGDAGHQNGVNQGDFRKVARLELAGEFRLQGNITSMAAVRTSTSVGAAGMDSILLTFRDAKMSLIEYSRSQQTIVTVSIHYYEKEELKKDLVGERTPPEVRVDPQFRCAAMTFYGDKVAILPFKQDGGVQAEGDDATIKHPFLPSFVIPQTAFDFKIKNIIDFEFLYGFVEPTLAILYETVQTWTGRLAARRDTRALIVISVDTTMKTFPIIYHVQQIPYNAYKIVPLPLPVGGVLVLSTNALIHIDQTSVPGVACAVNKFYGLEVDLPTPPSIESLGPATRKDNPLYHNSNVIDMKHMSISLEGAEAIIINPDTLFLVTRSGEMLIVELVGNDDGFGWRRRKGGVKDFKITRVGIRALMPVCSCRMGGSGSGSGGIRNLSRSLGGLGGVGQGFSQNGTSAGYIFLGSRVADSLLIRFKEHDILGRPRLDATTAGKTQPMDVDDDDDDLYGDSNASKAISSGSANGVVFTGVRFELKICDSIPGTGPIRDMAVGESAKYFEDSYRPSSLRKDLEVVGCLGEGADGALGVFQKNVRPKILTTVELPHVQDIWTVRCSKEGNPDGYHSFLLMSEEAKTTVLETGEELQEVQGKDFYTAGTTLCAASVLDGKMVQDITIGDKDHWVVSSSVQDPYIILQTSDDDIQLFVINEKSLEITIVHELKGQPVSSCCLYLDDSDGKLMRKSEELRRSTVWQWDSTGFLDTSPALQPTDSHIGVVPGPMDLDAGVPDDDDDDLYGDTRSIPKAKPIPSKGENNDKKGDNLKIGNQYFAFIYFEDGTLNPEEAKPFVEVNEIIVVSLGPNSDSRDPYLMVRTTSGDLVIYRLFAYLETPMRRHANNKDAPMTSTSPLGYVPGEHLAIRFVKVSHDHFSRELKMYRDTDGDKLQPVQSQQKKAFTKKHYLKPFTRIVGPSPAGSVSYTGVMMTGPKPCWIMVGIEGSSLPSLELLDPLYKDVGVNHISVEPSLKQRGKRTIRIHPCSVDGEMRTFTEFHNVNVPDGFIYLNSYGLLRLCQLPWQFNYDMDWPFCKVNLKRTPQKVTYHYESETYVIAASTPSPFRLSKAQHAAALAAGVIEEGETLDIVRDSSKEDRTGLYYPSIPAFNIELVSPITWETVDRFAFNEYEQVLACHAVSLQSKQTTSGRKLFLAVGTGWFRGEDLSVRGRLLLFDIIDVVPEIDNPQTNHKLKSILTQEEKTPVTAIAGIILYTFEDGESLSGVAFIDVNIYVNSVTSVKNMIVVGDVMKSVLFIGFQEEPPQLKLLGKDYYPLQVHSLEYLISDQNTSFVVTDTDGNVHLMNYAPYNIQSELGQKLIRRGEFHTGSRIQNLIRMRKMGHKDARTGTVVLPKQFWNVCGTLDGAISILTPVSEKLYKRAYALYSKMVNSVQYHAGLNPRGFRQIRQKIRPLSTAMSSGPPGPRFILDGDILYQYFSLSMDQQLELAKAVGSTTERIIDDLLEGLSGTDYF